MLGTCLTVALVFVGQAQTQQKDVKPRPWAVIAKRHVMAVKVYALDDPDHPFAAVKEPVLHRIQEVEGTSKGSIFLWVEPSGRPAAISDVFVFQEGPERYSLNNEWHSLSESPLQAESPDGVLFSAPARRWNGSRSRTPRRPPTRRPRPTGKPAGLPNGSAPTRSIARKRNITCGC